MSAFRLNPAIDRDAIAAVYRMDGQAVIEPFLDEHGARLLADNLGRREDWRHVLNSDDKVFEIPRNQLLEMPAEELARIDSAVIQSARHGFQYRFDTVRVPDQDEERRTRGDLLDQFAMWMSSKAVVEWFRGVTGDDAIDFADAQATAYHPGAFLNGHDDDVRGKNRRAAYVLGLTRGWRVEWGGLLLFHRGTAFEGVVPGFNRLTVFRVPQMHSVSFVAPSAVKPRLSITGWLRQAG